MSLVKQHSTPELTEDVDSGQFSSVNFSKTTLFSDLIVMRDY